MCAIITCSSSENALDYKRRILGPNIKEFPLLHKLSIILTALQYKLHIIYNGVGTVCKTLLGTIPHVLTPSGTPGLSVQAQCGIWPLAIECLMPITESPGF